MLSNERFSCMIMTTCLIRWMSAGACACTVGAVAEKSPVAAASMATTAARRALILFPWAARLPMSLPPRRETKGSGPAYQAEGQAGIGSGELDGRAVVLGGGGGRPRAGAPGRGGARPMPPRGATAT